MMKKQIFLLIMIFLLSFTIVSARNALGPNMISRYEGERDMIGFLDDNNNWTGVNSFLNFTYINYILLNVTGSINASSFCINGLCIDSWNDVNSTGDFVPYSGAVSNVDLGSNNLTLNTINITGNLYVDEYGQGYDGEFDQWGINTLWLGELILNPIAPYGIDPNSNFYGNNSYFNNMYVSNELCFGGDCISSWNDVNSTGSFVPYNGAVSNVDLGSYNLTTNGNVGIGTTAATQKLDVNGSVNVSGNIYGDSDYYIQVGDFEGLVIKEGRILAENGLGTNRGIFAAKTSDDWSSNLKIFNEQFALIKQGSNGEYNVTTNVFCDYVADNFAENDTQKPRKALILTNGSYVSATARVFTFINSSCVELNLNPAWDTDLTSVSWIERTGMVTNFGAGEVYDFVVGKAEESMFKIGNPGSTAPQTLWINDISGADQHKGFTLDYEMGNYDGQIAMNIFMKAGDDQMVNKKLIMMLMEGDASKMNSSDGTFIDMKMIGQPLTMDGSITGIKMPPGMKNLIDVGSADVINKTYYNAVNITANVTNSSSGLPTVFENDNDYLYFGSEGNFTALSILFDTPSSANLNLEYYYCNSSGDYVELTEVVDSTKGFRISGTIIFQNPVDRGVCNTEYDGTPFSDTTDYSYIALKRTRNSIATSPIISFLSISGESTNMFLADDMMRLNPVDTAPETCVAAILGAIYFDISEDQMCVCTSGGWKEMDATGSDCT